MHIYRKYNKEPLKTVELSIDRDNQKVIKELITTMAEISDVFELSRGMTLRKMNHVITVRTAKMKEKNLAHLVAYGLYELRNKRADAIKLILINPEQTGDIKEESWTLFQQLLRRGGGYLDYTKEDLDWEQMRLCLNKACLDFVQSYDALRKELDDIVKVDEYSRPMAFKRKFSFSRETTNLLSLYNRCFNKMDALISGTHLQYNPNPSFQRDFVWTLEKKQAFIHSLIEQIPIGSFYVNFSKSYDPEMKLGEGYGGLVWDGKQRLHALHDFILGKFSIMLGGKEVFYHDSTGFFNQAIQECNIVIFESNYDTLEEVIDAYIAINQNQVKHTDEDIQKAQDYLKVNSVH